MRKRLGALTAAMIDKAVPVSYCIKLKTKKMPKRYLYIQTTAFMSEAEKKRDHETIGGTN